MRSIKRLSAAIVSAALISTATVVPTGSLLSAMAAEPVVNASTDNLNGFIYPKDVDFGQVVKSAEKSVDFTVQNVGTDPIQLPNETVSNGIKITFDRGALANGEKATGTVTITAKDIPASYDGRILMDIKIGSDDPTPVALKVKVAVVDDLTVTLGEGVKTDRLYGDVNPIFFQVTGGVRDENNAIPAENFTWIVDGQSSPVAASDLEFARGNYTVTYPGPLQKNTNVKLSVTDVDSNEQSTSQDFTVKSVFESATAKVDFGTVQLGTDILPKTIRLKNTADTSEIPELSKTGSFFDISVVSEGKQVPAGGIYELQVTAKQDLKPGTYSGAILVSGLQIPVELVVADPAAQTPESQKDKEDGQDSKQGFRKFLPWIVLVLVILGLGAAAAPQLLPPPPAPPAP